jgi:hypothetical protein
MVERFKETEFHYIYEAQLVQVSLEILLAVNVQN